jgi:signal transduction histidine kinase
MANGVDECRRALGRAIRAHQSEIESRWLDRVLKDLAGRADVQPTHLRNGMPDYLEALADLLSNPHPSRQDGTARWETVARDHGITRVRIGFDIDQLVREFMILRHTIQTVAQEHGVGTTDAEGALADNIEDAIASSVRAYVETRDYEARRVQAQNVGFLIHELRNPITIARFAFEQMCKHATEEQRRPCAALDRSLGTLTQLIDNVLATERLEAGSVEPHFADVTIGELVDAATAAAREAATEKHLAFEVQCPADRKVRVDPLLTESAIQNLVDNAVKYTDHGRVELVVDEQPTTWSVHVRDTGPGLSPEELRTIFEPFRRGKTSKQGSGLGLAITKRAIEAQGGSIHVESGGPSGCHFWFELPKHCPSTDRATRTTSGEQAETSNAGAASAAAAPPVVPSGGASRTSPRSTRARRTDSR